MHTDRRDGIAREGESLRHDAWRIQLLHETVAQEAAERRRAAAMRGAVAVGLVIGVLGSLSLYLPS